MGPKTSGSLHLIPAPTQWQRAASIGGSYTDIVAATAVQYTPGDDDVGALLRVTVTYTDLRATQESVTSDSTTTITNLNDSPIGELLIEGGAVEGRTLQAMNAFVDADGIGNVSYQWQRASQLDLIFSNIPGATSSDYALDDDDVGKVVRVRVTRMCGG